MSENEPSAHGIDDAPPTERSAPHGDVETVERDEKVEQTSEHTADAAAGSNRASPGSSGAPPCRR